MFKMIFAILFCIFVVLGFSFDFFNMFISFFHTFQQRIVIVITGSRTISPRQYPQTISPGQYPPWTISPWIISPEHYTEQQFKIHNNSKVQYTEQVFFIYFYTGVIYILLYTGVGILNRWILWGFYSQGILSWGYCTGGYCPGGDIVREGILSWYRHN